MRFVIEKKAFPTSQGFVLTIPECSEILAVVQEPSGPFLYLKRTGEVSDDTPRVAHEIFCIPPDMPVDIKEGMDVKLLGRVQAHITPTIISGPHDLPQLVVMHVFEIVEKASIESTK